MFSRKRLWSGKCISTVQQASVSSNAESNQDMNRLSDCKSPMDDTALLFVRCLWKT